MKGKRLSSGSIVDNCKTLHLYLNVIANHNRTLTRFIYQWCSKMTMCNAVISKR